MASFWLVEVIKNSKKELKHFESKDEAIQHLLRHKAYSLLEKMPRNGNQRADVFMEIAPEFVEYAESCADHVVEVAPISSKK